MPIESKQYQWRPDDRYRQWNVSDDCFFPLADALQYRVENWHHPSPDEEDDKRPDYAEVLERRFYDSFDRPLEQDFQRFDVTRAIIWLMVHAPSAAVEVQQHLDDLRQCLDLDQCDRKPDEMVIALANAAWYLRQLATELNTRTPAIVQGAKNPIEPIAQSAKEWPPDDGWGFAPGIAAFKGKEFVVSGVLLHFLRRFAGARRPLSYDDLQELCPSGDAEQATVRRHLSMLRKRLREGLNLNSGFDPLLTSKGTPTTWTLAEQLRGPIVTEK
jgi:hypothetical protein